MTSLDMTDTPFAVYLFHAALFMQKLGFKVSFRSSVSAISFKDAIDLLCFERPHR